MSSAAPSAASPAIERHSRYAESAWRTRQLPVALAWLFVLVSFFVVSLFEPGFRSGANIRSIVDQAVILGVVGLGQTIVIIARGVDLSVPSMMGVAGVVLARHGSGASEVIEALLAIAAVAVALGVVNGFCVAVLRAPAIIVTLATNTLTLGALLVTSGGSTSQTGGQIPEIFRTLATGQIGPFAAAGAVWLGVAIFATLLMTATRYGRHIYAIGNNPLAARMSGVPVARTIIAAYVFSALCAAIGGLLLSGYLNQSFPAMGSTYLFTSIAVVLIGGASILGGSGHYLGTVAGALLLSILGGVLAILNLGPAYLRILYGVLIFATVGLVTLFSERGRET